MNSYLAGLDTENSNPRSASIDQLSTLEMVALMNAEDALVAGAVEKESANIAQAVDIIAEAFKNGGRLIYIGAGTSGRLGVLDASECPPTFGTNPEMVQGHIAGGDTAIRHAVENAEDDDKAGAALINQLKITKKDIVVGITASGSAPYVIGAVTEANQLGAATIAVVTNANTKLAEVAQISIAPEVGSEVIMGSTRLKSGTAQKMVLNMLTTLSMVKMGKVYGNLMVDLRATNKKLLERSVRIVSMATGVENEVASAKLKEAEMHVKTAIMMIKTSTELPIATTYLKQAEGHLEQAIQAYQEEQV